ncbi:MAG: hypothetical protein KJO69_00555 [Gammaproteobacteria bacterium]|nr:hypothetical protein [Gammaproteobacteria bacterium]NNJ72217.1 hypothetical protein [Enterobacterales bacterium]
MNNKHMMKIGIIIAIASLPLYAADETEGKVALNACAEALASKLEATKGHPVAYNVDPQGRGIEKRVESRDVIYLDAKALNSDEVIARANCIVNGDATVAKLVALPLNAPEASVRARNMY